MRGSKLFFSLLGLLFSFSVLFLGSALMLLSKSAVGDHFLEKLQTKDLFFTGMLVFFLGTLFLALLTLMFKRDYLLIKMGKNLVSVEEKSVNLIVREVLKRTFPGRVCSNSVVIHNHKRIEILLNLPFALESEGKLLEKLELELEKELAFSLNYREEFLLNVHFAPKKEKEEFSYFPA